MEPITHSIKSDHPEWNESYYLAFLNKEHNIGGVSRIGFKPNKQEGMTFFFLFSSLWLRILALSAFEDGIRNALSQN